MYWNHHDMTGWDWFTASVGMVLMWALLIAVAVMLYRGLNRASEPGTTTARPSPEQLLAERFARGEVDEEEYHRRLAVLRGDGPTLTKH
ncbi:SHOCT domain-containing protein [Streptomyces sp. NPDC005648]|uniref:SHOCT domain-containing protein n=1 Tax=Streptomyces sp. NPDC005648 TaxID=3157044 RepID=UPI0033BDA60D